MPFKSKAQRRKFAQLLVEGEITPEVYEEWNRETGGALLPERVKPKSKRSRKRKTTRPSTRRTSMRKRSPGTVKRKGTKKRSARQ